MSEAVAFKYTIQYGSSLSNKLQVKRGSDKNSEVRCVLEK